MSLQLSKKELILLLCSLLLIISVFVGGHFLFLKPKQQEMSSKQSQLATEEQLLAAIQTRSGGTNQPSAESVAELQKKVPVKQQLEQLILDLNKAEVLSNSLITSMNFSEGEVVLNPEDNQPEEQEGIDETQQTESQGAEESDQQVESTPWPEGVKKLNINLNVASPNYYDLMEFLETVESLNRLVVIESVSFAGNAELTNVEQENQDLTYSLTLAAFYMPELEDLQDQLPELEVPAPSNKTNPFASSPDISSDTPS